MSEKKDINQLLSLLKDVSMRAKNQKNRSYLRRNSKTFDPPTQSTSLDKQDEKNDPQEKEKERHESEKIEKIKKQEEKQEEKLDEREETKKERLEERGKVEIKKEILVEESPKEENRQNNQNQSDSIVENNQEEWNKISKMAIGKKSKQRFC